MSYLIKPTHYQQLLDMKQTELGIKQIKEFFQQKSVLRTPFAPCHGTFICPDRYGYQRRSEWCGTCRFLSHQGSGRPAC